MQNKKISKKNKEIAKYVQNVFGTKPQVNRFYDKYNIHYIDLLSCFDTPQTNLISYSTIGLSDYQINKNALPNNTGVEFLGVAETKYKKYANVIATAAFNVIKLNFKAYPGAIYPNILKMYNLSKQLPHIMLDTPFLWENKFNCRKFNETKVCWLLLIPISNKEFNYAKSKSVDALIDLFVKEKINIFNFERPSVVS